LDFIKEKGEKVTKDLPTTDLQFFDLKRKRETKIEVMCVSSFFLYVSFCSISYRQIKKLGPNGTPRDKNVPSP